MLQVPVRHLLRIAKSVAATHPEIAGGLNRPVFRKGEQAFLASVRAIAEEATAQRDIFIQHGMSEEVLGELSQMLEAYEQGIHEANAGRRAHTGASAELRGLSKELMRMLQQLDAIVLYRFRDRPELLGAWASARNIAWPLGEPAGPAPVTEKETAA